MTRRFTDRIIIYRLGSIGDTVAALPCFHLIERTFPTSERIVLTNIPESSKAAPLETILQGGGFIHGSIPYPLGLRSPTALARLAKVLRDQDAHTLIYLAASRGLWAARRDVLFFKLSGVGQIIGAPLTADLERNHVDDVGIIERESHRLGRTLRPLGSINFADRSWWDLRLTEEERAAADDALGEIKLPHFIAVNTGGKAAQKDWGVESWGAFLERLGERLPDWPLAFVGSQEDQDRAATLRTRWTGKVVDLCGRLSPRESAAALSRATLFVGHDSGAFHLADAVGTPAVGIFGHYNQPKQWHPSGTTTRVVHRMSGLSDITPDEILEEIRELGVIPELAVDQG